MTYASGTTVSESRSIEQVRKVLSDAGALDVQVGLSEREGAIAFRKGNMAFRFRVPLAVPADFEKHLPRGAYYQKTRSKEAQLKLAQQKNRELWRALYATIKAKMVSAESGIETFEEAFFAQAVTNELDATGKRQTVYQWLMAKEIGSSGTLRLQAGEPR